MISQVQFGSQAMSESKQAMPETSRFDGPSSLNVSGSENQFAGHAAGSLPKPGFSS